LKISTETQLQLKTQNWITLSQERH